MLLPKKKSALCPFVYFVHWQHKLANAQSRSGNLLLVLIYIPLKFIFCPSITVCNNLPLKICCESVVNIAFFAIFLFNLQRSKILESSNLIFKWAQNFCLECSNFFFFGWSTTHINLKFIFLRYNFFFQVKVVL